MEDILREILYELKKINHKLYESDASEDVITEKVIENINNSSRLSKHNSIRV